MGKDGKKHHSSIFFKGCKENDIIIGLDDVCKNLQIKMLDELDKRQEGDKHIDIPCRFEIIAAGDSKDYGTIYKLLVGRVFENAGEALLEMNRINGGVHKITHVFKVGKYKVLDS